MVKVLFVCMGNICRSPTAHGVFEHIVNKSGLARQIIIESAGTHAYHVGESPDPRSQRTAQKRGYDLSRQSSQKIKKKDFEQFDIILAMDRDNYRNLLKICPDTHADKLRLFMEFAPHMDIDEVPDPYYGGGNGFERVLDMVEQASDGLFEYLRKHYPIDSGSR